MTSASLNARAFAALAVLALFPVFVLATVYAIAAAAVYVGAHVTGGAGAHLFVLAIPLILAVTAATRNVMRARSHEPLPGTELSRDDHPQLWAELGAISSAMDQPPPDRVVVAPIVNAMVTTAAGQREVLIGYPLLAGLNRLQLRAVLAHEMGHLAHGHTRTGFLAYRMGGLLEETVQRMEPGIVRSLISGYHRFYLLIALSVVRDHERQADEWSARLAGGPQAATMFAELARIDAVWDLLCENYLPQATQVKARPGLAMAMQQLRQAHETRLDDLAASRTSRAASRWSSHPADRERIRLLDEASPVQPGPADLYPAWQLLGHRTVADSAAAPDWDAAGEALLALEASLLPPGAPAATWERVVHDFHLKETRTQVSLALDQLVAQAPATPLTLRGLLQALSAGPQPHGPGAALVEPLIRGDVPASERQEIVAQALEGTTRAAIELAVLNAGRARWTLQWEGPARLEYLDQLGLPQPWPDEFTVSAPIDDYSINPALTALHAAGISIDAPLVDDLAAQAQARTLSSITTGAIAAAQVRPPRPGQRRRVLYDVLLMDDGLVIAPAKLSAGDRIIMVLQSQYLPGAAQRRATARIKDLAQAVDGDPKAYASERRRGVTWVPYAEVTSARFKNGAAAKAGMANRRLTLGWPGSNDTLQLRWTYFTVELGDVSDLLTRALDV
jgi:Zn-dependent protease with chaperone function